MGKTIAAMSEPDELPAIAIEGDVPVAAGGAVGRIPGKAGKGLAGVGIAVDLHVAKTRGDRSAWGAIQILGGAVGGDFAPGVNGDEFHKWMGAGENTREFGLPHNPHFHTSLTCSLIRIP